MRLAVLRLPIPGASQSGDCMKRPLDGAVRPRTSSSPRLPGPRRIQARTPAADRASRRELPQGDHRQGPGQLHEAVPAREDHLVLRLHGRRRRPRPRAHPRQRSVDTASTEGLQRQAARVHRGHRQGPGTPGGSLLEHPRIDTDGEVARVWFDYSFMVGNYKQDSGKDAWHLLRTDAGRKIASVVWSMDSNPAPPPPNARR